MPPSSPSNENDLASALTEYLTRMQVSIGIGQLSMAAGEVAVLLVHRVNERQQMKGVEVLAGVVDDRLATAVLKEAYPTDASGTWGR